jgi:hypothetical protein
VQSVEISHETASRTPHAGGTPELDVAGCIKIFREKASGGKTDRPELAKLLRRLDADDVLVVTRLNRLARSTRDLLNVLDIIATRGAGFRSLKDTWANTNTPHGRLMLTVLGGLAEFERELIKARTGEGRKRAKDRGVPDAQTIDQNSDLQDSVTLSPGPCGKGGRNVQSGTGREKHEARSGRSQPDERDAGGFATLSKNDRLV